MDIKAPEKQKLLETVDLQQRLDAVLELLAQRLEVLRVATATRHKLRLTYLDAQQRPSQRTVHPLGCFFWGQVWTLAAWCELRQAFRSFRVDRIEALEVLDERFRDEPGKTLPDLFRLTNPER